MATDANGNNGVAAAGGVPQEASRWILSLFVLRRPAPLKGRGNIVIFRPGVGDVFAAFRAACPLLLLASLFLLWLFLLFCFTRFFSPAYFFCLQKARTSWHGFCRGKAAADAAPFPAATDDWSSVNLYGKAGTNTWPIASWSIGSWSQGDFLQHVFQWLGQSPRPEVFVCAIVCDGAGLSVLFATADVLNHLNLDGTLMVSIFAKSRCWSRICTCTRTRWVIRFGKRVLRWSGSSVLFWWTAWMKMKELWRA